MDRDLHFSSATDEWATPQGLFDRVNALYHLNLDVCADDFNKKCSRYFTKVDDGLHQVWTGRCWMNPPYGRKVTGQWVEKAFLSAVTTAEIVVCLLPARTDTAWFHNFVLPFSEFAFLRGRVKFGGATHGAPFPSMLAVFGGP